MRLHKIEIQNFRLLAKVELLLEAKSTVIVGRNNSGKTSLTELFRRLLGDSTPSFRLEDFSLSAHEGFWKAFQAKEQRKTDDELRKLFPIIEVKLTIAYDKAAANLGVLGECIIDLDPNCEQAVVQIRYMLREGEIPAFFTGLKIDTTKPEAEQRAAFCSAIRDLLPKFYSSSVEAVDPSDATNIKTLDWATLRAVLAGGFVNAQRGLDDVTNKERDVLGKVLEALFRSAKSDSANEKDQGVAKQLETAVQGIQTSIDTGFNVQLQELLPAFNLFGYPGFADPSLRTETTLGVERLLTNHTKVHYAGVNGINLPEAYNGLGARNLIFILLKLLEFYKAFLIQKTAPGVHLIFIEEPEVHLHPQMQEVFIAQLTRIATEFEKTIGKGRKWPVQFVVTTHSSHMANKAEFAAMRYFLVKGHGSAANLRSTVIKDLRSGLEGTAADNLEFLHKYMTLTRCDLLFADKAVLIEGTSERLLLPMMIQVLEQANPAAPKLSSQYVSVVEVGGAYAHLFVPLVKFLELPTLIITDLDATKETTTKNGKKVWVACKVSEGQRTSNACINDWFELPGVAPADLIAKTDADKTDGNLRIAYEVPEANGKLCGRSFEDTFILANWSMFGLAAPSEDEAWEKAKEDGKSDFALTYAIKKTGWSVPRYIAEGVEWLAQLDQPQSIQPAAVAGVPRPHQFKDQMPDTAPNPAKLASQEAWSQLQTSLDRRHSFIFEAGAGAGKTYSLIEALRYLIKRDGTELIRNYQQVACITYTNVATKEIETRTDRHPAIYSSTIHSFCWTLIQGFQPFLRKEILNIEGWPERLKESAKRTVDRIIKDRVEELGEEGADILAIAASLHSDLKQLENIGTRNVEYSLGHPRADKTTISLSHNDVLVLVAKLLANEKFRRVLVNRFPVVFIDEYQDTDNVIFDALKTHVIGTDGSPLIGFFGDHWQKIYGTGCGKIEHPKLNRIGKKANFRSVSAIVDCLNRMRPELPQQVEDPTACGSLVVFHTNEWIGERQTGAQWKGDLPDTIAHSYLQVVQKKLAETGWDFAPEVSKILMLTHNVLAAEQGYQQLAAALPRTESFIKKEDPHIAFLVDTVEPVCGAFVRKRYGEMFAVFGAKLQAIRSHGDKAAWSEHLTSVVKLRETETIGAVLDDLRKKRLFPLPEAVERKERALEKHAGALKPDEPDEIKRLRELRAVPYKQVVALRQFIEEKTPFSTKHGVKGAEFENILVVFGRGWNLYNFAQFLEWSGASGVPVGKTDAYERNRNLFYVACSRPKKRLPLLFTQELTPSALATIGAWFGDKAIHALPKL